MFARILEQNKQTNKQINSVFLYVQKSTDNCYLIPAENKIRVSFLNKDKNRSNHFFKIRIRKNNKARLRLYKRWPCSTYILNRIN